MPVFVGCRLALVSQHLVRHDHKHADLAGYLDDIALTVGPSEAPDIDRAVALVGFPEGLQLLLLRRATVCHLELVN